MAATLSELICKGCAIVTDNNIGSFKDKLKQLADLFTSVQSFKHATREAMDNTLNKIEDIEGKKRYKPLTDKEFLIIQDCQKIIDENKSIIQNFIQILTTRFVKKQQEMISNITLDNFNANPILCTTLNINTPEDFVRFYTYQAIGRSMVTSMGFLVEDLLLYSNRDVFDGEGFKEGKDTKFDLVIDRLGQVKAYLEIKSGFNDMDKAQVKHYAKEIKWVEKQGYKGYIGITYGKRTDNTVTASLLPKYLPKWKSRTLIGKELWDYVSENENYHLILLQNIKDVVNTILENVSIVQKIEERIDYLTTQFKNNHNNMEEYYQSLW